MRSALAISTHWWHPALGVMNGRRRDETANVSRTGRAASVLSALPNMVQRLFQNILHMVVIQGIKNIFALPAGPHQLRVLQ